MVAVGAARMQRLNPRPHRSDALPGKEKAAPKGRLFDQTGLNSALACLEPALCLVDHVDTALAAHHAAVAVPVLQRTKRVADFHRRSPCRGACGAPWFPFAAQVLRLMVGDTGIEPVTPSMSTKCSTAELIALYPTNTTRESTRVGPAFYKA